MIHGDQAFERFCEYDWKRCLDIGAGKDLPHTKLMRAMGKDVVAVDLALTPGRNDFPQGFPPWNHSDFHAPCENYDAIWCCHILEHQEDAGYCLREIFRVAKPGAIVAITVPPLKHEIVGGHVSLWNEGLLLYNMILAGFDCRKARVGVYGYNLSVIVKKDYDEVVPFKHNLKHDYGDIGRLAQYFPEGIAYEGFDGQIGNVDW